LLLALLFWDQIDLSYSGKKAEKRRGEARRERQTRGEEEGGARRGGDRCQREN
jgi:hypothetical protein